MTPEELRDALALRWGGLVDFSHAQVETLRKVVRELCAPYLPACRQHAVEIIARGHIRAAIDYALDRGVPADAFMGLILLLPEPDPKNAVLLTSNQTYIRQKLERFALEP